MMDKDIEYKIKHGNYIPVDPEINKKSSFS